MKIVTQVNNLRTEIVALKTFCECDSEGRLIFLGGISEDHFDTDIGKVVWKRLRTLNLEKKLPSEGAWEGILNDPVLSEESYQDVLQQFEDTVVSIEPEFVSSIIENLEFLRQKREAIESIQKVVQGISKAGTKGDIVTAIAPLLSRAKRITETATGEALFRLDNLEMLEYLKECRQNRGKLLGSLWYQFDAVNMGFSLGSLITIAANTSGGKSAIAALNLLYNFVLQGEHVAVVSLEMSVEQIVERQTSFVSGVPFSRVRSAKWTTEDEQQIKLATNVFNKTIEKVGGQYWLLDTSSLSTKTDLTIFEALSIPYEKGARVILVDYINLLKKDDKEDMNSFLRDISVEAKNFARKHNCIVVLLAQLNEEERVMYSKAVEHNSDNVIIWNYSYKNRPGYIQLKQTKARNQALYNFYLVEDFETMRVYDLLDPMGLALMLSRSSGKRLIRKANEYFGIRKLIEIDKIKDLDSIGVNKQEFLEDIDWNVLTDNAVPAPNAPHVSVVLDMAREMLNLIAIHEPQVAIRILDNIKNSAILKPYKEYIDDLELPYNAKKLLDESITPNKGLDAKKKSLIEKIRKDLLSAQQGVFVEVDKSLNDNRLQDIVEDKKKVYSETYQRLHGKEPEKFFDKQNTASSIGELSKSMSMWAKLSAESQQEKQGKPIPIDTTNEPFKRKNGLFGAMEGKDNTPTDKDSLGITVTEDYDSYWSKIAKDTPDSIDTMYSEVRSMQGIRPPSFLSASYEAYMDAYKNKISLVGKKIGQIKDTIVRNIDYNVMHTVIKSRGKWVRCHAMEMQKQYLLDRVVQQVCTTEPKISNTEFPSVNDLLPSNPENIMNLKTYPLDTNIGRILDFMAFSGGSIDRPEEDKIEVKEKFKPTKNGSSFWKVLFREPQYIGCIRSDNVQYVGYDFLKNTVHLDTWEKLLKINGLERDRLVKSLAWSMVDPASRYDNLLLLKVKSEVHKTLGVLYTKKQGIPKNTVKTDIYI